jgi:hypothetical protein
MQAATTHLQDFIIDKQLFNVPNVQLLETVWKVDNESTCETQLRQAARPRDLHSNCNYVRQ